MNSAVLAYVLVMVAADATPPAAMGSGEARQVTALRAAIDHLEATFGPAYPQAAAFRSRLDQWQAESCAGQPGDAARLARFEVLKREALLANPLVCRQPLLFVVRKQYARDHHNTETMFQTGEINTGSFAGGGALKRLDVLSGQTTTLVDLPEGVVRDPDVHFEGRRMLVALRKNRADDYHIYELNADGTGLKQLTRGAGVTDIDPFYLPDGRIGFTATREPKYCMCNRHIMGNLYTMEADGANLQQIGHSTLHEGHGAVADDGRILYDRWEYVDRNFGDAQGVWSVNPDGTNHAIYWGNNTNSPGGVIDARPVPGSPLFVATFAACHDRPWGALALIDRRRGLDLRPPVLRTWPAEAIELVGVGGYDSYRALKVKYEDPFPLSEKFFLCSRMTGAGEQMGIYLVDIFGNEVLVHAEEPGCFDPMPLAPRHRPTAIPSRVDLKKSEGYFYISDVYRGAGMQRVARGTIRQVRVVESPEKRFFTGPAWDGGTGQQAPGMGWDDFNNKRVLGTAPVEEDGSALFAVPADRYVYFQLLDAEGRMVQSMRSGTIVRPGETAGCVGCHEDRLASAPVYQPAVTRRTPHALTPWRGPARTFSYLAEVQPVFDRLCVSCHDYEKPAGAKLNLAGDVGLIFNTSYVELRKKGFVRVVGAGPHQVQSPMSWGSHASRLAQVMLAGHGQAEIDRQVHIDAESIDRVLTWIDINAPFYPEYASAYPQNQHGRSPLAPAEMQRLIELTGMSLGKRQTENCLLVNFTRPSLSPCLQPIGESRPAAYAEALALITTGQRRLQRQPNPGQPGFQLTSDDDVRREAKYVERREIEAKSRAALANGGKHYEP